MNNLETLAWVRVAASGVIMVGILNSIVNPIVWLKKILKTNNQIKHSDHNNNIEIVISKLTWQNI